MEDKLNTYISECNDLNEIQEIIDCDDSRIDTVVKFMLEAEEKE